MNAHPTIATCPQCCAPDLVRRVSAVCWDGHSQVTTHGVHVGAVVGDGLWPLVGVGRQHATQTSHLAAALAPPLGPPTRTALHLWMFALGVYCLSTLALVLWASSLPTQPPVPTLGRLVLSGCCLSPALIALAFVIPATIRAHRHDRHGCG